MKRLTKIFGILVILTILLSLPFTVLAAPVGKVSSLEGNVDITAGAKARDAKLGDAVNAGDILRAKSKSRAEITFLDGNILRLAENTRVRITDYQPGEGKTTTLDLFRGKTQNIVAGLSKDARYEIKTPTAIVGVRGTNFIAFFQNGVSGFIPKEGTIYGYNRTMPKDIKIVTPGQAIMVLAADKPPVVQPATSADVEKHMKDTAPEEKKDEKEKDKEKKEEGPATPAAAPLPPPPVPTTVPLAIPTTVATTVQTTTTTTTTTVATTVPPTVSGPITGGAITKMVTGTVKQSQYASLYKLPAGTKAHDEFYTANGTNYLRVRYEDMYFDDGIGVNRGYRFEQARYIAKASPDVWMQERQTWYWPNQFFVSFNHDGSGEGVQDRGRTYDLLPNLDLAATPTSGGGNSATHPLFFGTVGSAASFPADYTIGTPGTGTFVKTLDWTITGVNSREQVGQFTGTFGVLGSDSMALWSSSSKANPVKIALKGAYTHDTGYDGPAFRGTVGYYGTLDKYVETAPGYGGAYYGQITGYMPDTGSTLPMKGELHALYIYNPDSTTNKAGVITGTLTPGAGTTTFPETGTWQAEGTMNRMTALEIDNTSGTTAATLSATVVSGRAGIDVTAGFYNPTGAPGLALGMGHGYMPSISGIDSFGLFFLGHGFINRHENASTGTTWETRGWGEFGRYQRTDSPSQNYRDYGYWYADLTNKSWADNQLSADFNGRFLTLMKYGTMTGETAGTYSSDGTWGAGSQGYWQKDGDLGFASNIGGNTLKLRSEQDRLYSSGNSQYQYSLVDPQGGGKWGGRSYYYDAGANSTTIQNFDVKGPMLQGIYVKETWTTADGGATWSHATTQYPDEASYRAAIDGLAAPPPGTWQAAPSKDHYNLWANRFGGIMGGLNANLWTDQTSPLKFQGNYETMSDVKIAPSVSLGEIMSVNPLATFSAFANSELAIGGAYRGMVGVAVDSANALAGGLMALYQDKTTGAGLLYSNDIVGKAHPNVSAWEADGLLTVYPLTTGPVTGDPKLFAGSIFRSDETRIYNSGDVQVDAISGGTPPDKRFHQATILSIPGQSWSIWSVTSGGTATGGAQGPKRWVERREDEWNPRGGYQSTYSSINHEAPINGIFTGTVASAAAKFDETTNQTTGRKDSFTVVLGGVIKGLFDPATTPMTWTAVTLGGGMETSALISRQAAMDDAAKASFEKAMKIPAFDVGIANLRGNDGNLYVNIDGIKFFRFRTETDPRIWATGTAYGSYTSNPAAAGVGVPGTKVQLNSSGDLSGLTHTFEVKQWNAGGNNNWGAAIYRGAADTGGTLTRNAADAARTATGYLPAGAAATIPITELRGGAAGVLRPGVGIPGLPGSNSFVGTASGTVR